MILSQITKHFVQEALKRKILNINDLQKLKNEFSSKYKIKSLLNRELILAYKKIVQEKSDLKSLSFERVIRKRSVRTESGITSVTIVTKPYACPGKCVFCPTEKGIPKSYASNEPGIMRAILNDFDPKRQVKNRLQAYIGNGHTADKVEMIILGGTFSFYPHRYQTDFVRKMYEALNEGLGAKMKDEKCKIENVGSKMAKTLQKAQALNEKAEHRCVGLSVETRPDYITEKELLRFRKLGVTRIEIGVQHTVDRILTFNKRGHDIGAVKDAMRLMKDAGFKITSHLMPNLPGATITEDYQMFLDVFNDPDLRTDWLKIYPCSVVPFSELEQWFKQGRYQSYEQQDLIDLLIRVKQIVPLYIRITRLIRDIPDTSILSSASVSNLRQEIHQIISKNQSKFQMCQCIRCREIRSAEVNLAKTELNILEYEAQGGKEFFISIDDMSQNKLCANLRLRFPSQYFSRQKHFIKELEGAALIRELHVFGNESSIGSNQRGLAQHKGFGGQLLQQAELKAKQAGFSKIAVISGIGVREYYRKNGYHLEGSYMLKVLRKS